MISNVADSLLAVPAPVAYTLIALLVFAEAAVFVGFVLPGETAVFLGGVLAGTHRLSLPALIVLVVVAAVAGDSVGYEVGRRFGPRVLAWRVLIRHGAALEAAQRRLRERGGWAVFAARFTAFLRAVMPGLAGLSRMPYRRFFVYNAAGGVVWGAGVVLLGFFAGNSYAAVERGLGRATAVVTALVVGLAIFLAVRARRRRVSAGPPPSSSR